MVWKDKTYGQKAKKKKAMTMRNKIGSCKTKRDEGNAKGKVEWGWKGPEGIGKET